MTVKYPKNYNRRFLINIKSSDALEDNYILIAAGITSRSNNIDEQTQEYHYMDGRGTSETVVEGQKVSVSFTGSRAVGDPAQDHILDDLLFDIDNRDIEYVDYDDSVPIPTTGDKPLNGYHGRASIQITDFGSGDAGARQNIGFTLNYMGKPERGTMELINGKYKWTPKASVQS